jgi:hypothetical protein
MQELCDNLNNIKMMRTWLTQCDMNHRVCAKRVHSFIPTRLLDLEAFAFEAFDLDKGLDVRLVATKDWTPQQEVTDYISLSHCWGPAHKRPIMTHKSNIDELSTRIKFASLPRTFRDAVTVARQLHKRYLWIDSLCIIQNDEAEWARESALMGEVYNNAYCTLAAWSSEDSTGGCQQTTDIRHATRKRIFDIDIGRVNGHNLRYRLAQLPLRSWLDEYSGDNSAWGIKHHNEVPLKSRAWALQERILSRRIIYFGRWQLFWECGATQGTAQTPWGVTNGSWELRHEPQVTLYTKRKWYALLADYAERVLSVDSDKLTALSGLARVYQATFPDSRYVAGMWSSDLPAALLWYDRQGQGRRHEAYVAPTWSWASLKNTDSINELDAAMEVQTGSFADDTMAELEYGSPFALHVYTITKWDDPYGAITEGLLILSGALILHIDTIPSTDTPYVECGTWLTKGGHTVSWFYRDTCDDKTSDRECFILCLGVKLDGPERSSEQTTGLVLVRALTEDTRFERVGIAINVNKALFQTCEPLIVSLV